MTLLQRMKEAELFKEWESQEDDVSGEGWGGIPFVKVKVQTCLVPLPLFQFHLEQAKLRSKIRIETGRGTFYIIVL